MNEPYRPSPMDEAVEKLKLSEKDNDLTISLDGSSIVLKDLPLDYLTEEGKQLIASHLLSIESFRQSILTIQDDSSQEVTRNLVIKKDMNVPLPEWAAVLDNITVRHFIDDVSQAANLTPNHKALLTVFAKLHEYRKASSALDNSSVEDYNRLIDAMEMLCFSGNGVAQFFNEIIEKSQMDERTKQRFRDKLQKANVTAAASIQDSRENSGYIPRYIYKAHEALEPFSRVSATSQNFIGTLIKSSWFESPLKNADQTMWKRLAEYTGFSGMDDAHRAFYVLLYIRDEYSSYDYPHPELMPERTINALMLASPEDRRELTEG